MKKVALVTGCAKGIGKSIALTLAKDGYNIIGTYNKSKKEVEKLKSKIESIGVKIDLYKLDLIDENEINDFCKKLLNNYKNIDIFVNNASYSCDNEVSLKTKEEFINVLTVNLVAPFLLIQKLSKILTGGIVINVSSTDGINTYSRYNIDYSASKAGLNNLTKSLALAYEDIKFFAICPNWVNTESIKEMNQDFLKQEMLRVNQKKLIEPSEISDLIIDIVENDIKSGSILVMEDSND